MLAVVGGRQQVCMSCWTSGRTSPAGSVCCQAHMHCKSCSGPAVLAKDADEQPTRYFELPTSAYPQIAAAQE